MKPFLQILLIILLFITAFAVISFALDRLGVISLQSWGEELITHTPFLKSYVQTAEEYEELATLWKEVSKEREELLSRNKELEQELTRTAAQLDTLQARLTEGEKELEALQEKRQQESERIEKLVRIYSEMEPARAAAVFTSLDEELALKILRNLKEADAAAIMSSMPVEKAAGYSRGF